MDKSTQLKSILQLLGTSVTKQEFTDAVAQIVKYVKNIQATNEREWSLIKMAFAKLSTEVKADTQQDLAEKSGTTKKEVLAYMKPIMDKMLFEHDAMISEADAKLDSVKDGEDGHTPTQDELLALITPLIPKVENGKDAEPVDEAALEQRLMKRFNNVPRAHGGAAVHPMKFTDLSSQTNGSKKTFTVPKSVHAVVFTSDFPFVLIENNGFTLDGSRTQLTLTANNAPSTNSQLLFQYSALFNTTT